MGGACLLNIDVGAITIDHNSNKHVRNSSM
jgi:hypothetical protein